MFGKKTVTIETEIELELSERVDEVIEALDMSVEDFAEIALLRLASEFEQNGKIETESAHVAPAMDADGNNKPITIHLSEVQQKVMGDVAEVYGANITQATKHGLFSFEKPLNPEQHDGKTMLEAIKQLKEPDAYFEVRYEPEAITAQAELDRLKQTEADPDDEEEEHEED